MKKRTKRKFKVEIRKTCKICGGPLPTKRHRTYCSVKCRNAGNYKRLVETKGYDFLNERQRKYGYYKMLRDEREKYQCLVCGKWYRQVGSHIVQVHKMTAREYREKYGFDVKKGQLPEDLKKIKAEKAVKCGGYKNLKAGKEYWYKKGDKSAGRYKRSDQTLERLKTIGRGVSIKRESDNCIVCGEKLVKNQRKYCSRDCRVKDYKRIYKPQHGVKLFG